MRQVLETVGQRSRAVTSACLILRLWDPLLSLLSAIVRVLEYLLLECEVQYSSS